MYGTIQSCHWKQTNRLGTNQFVSNFEAFRECSGDKEDGTLNRSHFQQHYNPLFRAVLPRLAGHFTALIHSAERPRTSASFFNIFHWQCRTGHHFWHCLRSRREHQAMFWRARVRWPNILGAQFLPTLFYICSPVPKLTATFHVLRRYRSPSTTLLSLGGPLGNHHRKTLECHFLHGVLKSCVLKVSVCRASCFSPQWARLCSAVRRKAKCLHFVQNFLCTLCEACCSHKFQIVAGKG